VIAVNRRVLAVASGLLVLTAGEIGLFLWLNGAEIAANRAHAFVRKQAYEPAVELYQRALRRQPGRPELLLPLAKALAGSGRLAEARLAVGQVLALAPRDVQAR
jgi:Flp pilus assembly protein TadD